MDSSTHEQPADNNVTDQTPVTFTSPRAASLEPGHEGTDRHETLPQVQTEGPIPPTPGRPKAKMSLMKLVLLVLLGLVILGGGSALAYVGYIVPNKPENVVAKSITNLLSKEKGSFALTVGLSNDQSPVSQTYSLTGGYDENLNTKVDTTFEISAFKLTASALVRPKDKEFYIKVNELPSLISLMAGGSTDSPLSALAAKLGDNWIKVSVDDLKQMGAISDSQASGASSCIDAYVQYSTSQRDALAKALSDAYTDNMFIQATPEGSETVNGIQAKKYKLGYDTQKTQAFVGTLVKKLNESSTELSTACGAGSQNTVSMDEKIQIDDNRLTDMYVWVSGDKQLVKLDFKVAENENKTSISASFSDTAVDLTKPSKVITLKDLQTELAPILGSDPTLLQGVGNNALQLL